MSRKVVSTEHYDDYDVPLIGDGHNAGHYATVYDEKTGDTARMWSGKSLGDAIERANGWLDYKQGK